MSAEDRVAPSIKFISPNGTEFEAFWAGNNKSKAKKLGKFSAPDIKGTRIQDLDMLGEVYPLTFWFEGETHDLLGQAMWLALDEKGPWTIQHPIDGRLRLQLSQVTRKDQPIKDADRTIFETTWLIPLEEIDLISSASLKAQILEQLNEVNERIAEQLAAASNQDTASRIQALKDSATQVSNAITNGLARISELSADIQNITTEVQRATTTGLGNPTVAVGSLATQLSFLAQTPARATDNVSDRMNAYLNVGRNLFGEPAENPTFEARNDIAVREAGLNALAATLPLIVSTGVINTRTEAIEFSEAIQAFFDDMTDSLDETQKIFENNLIGSQYFSQSASFNDLALLISLGLEFLLRTFFDLKIEKRIVLTERISPIALVIKELGELGDNDINLDLFIASNKLKNTEILLLPIGKQVVFYV